MKNDLPPIRLDAADVTVVLAAKSDVIDLIYLGPRLPDREDLTQLVLAGKQGKHENQPDDVTTFGILPQARDGYAGPTAVRVASTYGQIASKFCLERFTKKDQELVATWQDTGHEIEVICHWQIGDTGAIVSRYEIRNHGRVPVRLESMPSLVLPMPAAYNRMTSFPGRWAREMTAETQPIGRSAISMRSRGGKPGYSGHNWLIFDDDAASCCIGYHLSWSGDYQSTVERDDDGRAIFVGGVSPESLGMDIAAGDRFISPEAVFIHAAGHDQLTQKLHEYARDFILPDRANWGPRKVHLNSWEALGFDLEEAKLEQLASDAAELGVERFVLDDGWFLGRRNDRAGLGDWTVDPEIFPSGLTPLIEHVHSLGMDFGLWVELEMVSPDSDLYRAHPDWCIHDSVDDRPTERNQLVLDLSRSDVCDHLFSMLDKLLSNHEIAYLKWDHNRRLFPMTGKDGAAPLAQTEGFCDLLGRIRAAHRHVEIEICSAGGGRADLELLKSCHRIWPSDNNDPVERVRIMQNWARFLPLEILGNHVGPSPNPITGRRMNMDFRSKVALFGHMGIEADPADMNDRERAILSRHITLYKQWREALHRGTYWKLDHTDDGIYAQMVVDGDRAVAMVAQTGFSKSFNAEPLRLKGLDKNAFYCVRLPEPWADKTSAYLDNASLRRNGLTLSGRLLMEQGLALPLTHPETAWLVTIERTGE